MPAPLIAALLLAATPLQEAPAVAPPPAVDENTVADVEVFGRRDLPQVAERFIDEVAAAPRGQNLARWHDRLCVGVVGFPREPAQYVADRVSRVGAAVGLRIGETGCKANVVIAASTDPDRLAREVVAADPIGFHPGRSATDLGRAALRNFQSSDAPVRWWQVSMPVEVDTGESAARLRGREPPVIRTRIASRLQSTVRSDLERVLIIVDADRMQGVDLAALSDYVAFLAVAQVDPKAVVGSAPSILSLFQPDRTSTRLTEWDAAYLLALYQSRNDRIDVQQQVQDIVRGITHLSPGETSAAPAQASQPTP